MIRKIIIIATFLMTSLFSYSAKLKDVKFTNGLFSINFASNDNETLVSADEDSRLIYVEIQNIDDKSFKLFTESLKEDMKNSNLFEEVVIEKDKNSVSITLQLAPKVAYTMDSNNKKIELALQKALKNKHLIILDPGHGGKDPGAMRGNIREKDIVLSVGKNLRDRLAKDFSERPKIGNKNKAALFVSIHANASENTSANGVEVFYFSKKSSPYAERIANFENSIGEKYGESSDKIVQISGELAYKKNQENSIRLAKKIASSIATGVNLKNGGVHGANFAVLRGFNGTGVLIELGFVSNQYDSSILTDSNYQEIMADEIASSIREYLTR